MDIRPSLLCLKLAMDSLFPACLAVNLIQGYCTPDSIILDLSLSQNAVRTVTHFKLPSKCNAILFIDPFKSNEYVIGKNNTKLMGVYVQASNAIMDVNSNNPNAYFYGQIKDEYLDITFNSTRQGELWFDSNATKQAGVSIFMFIAP